MAHKIDLNRGVTMRYTKAGVEVYMYKDTPGVFLNAFGTQVSDTLAREAGFPVDKLVNERRKRERKAEAGAAIDREFSASGVERKVIAERGGFKALSLGLGRHQVLDPEGTPVNDRPLSKEEALILLKHMTPDEPEQGVETPAPAPHIDQDTVPAEAEPKPKPKKGEPK